MCSISTSVSIGLSAAVWNVIAPCSRLTTSSFKDYVEVAVRLAAGGVGPRCVCGKQPATNNKQQYVHCDIRNKLLHKVRSIVGEKRLHAPLFNLVSECE